MSSPSSIESMDVLYIPDHIWPTILKYVNHLKLLVLRRICKHFKSIIEEMFDKNNLWKDLCLNSSNIKPWVWKIREKLFPYAEEYTSETLDKTWKDIFYSYKYWRAYSKRSSKLITLNLSDNSVVYNYIKCSDAYGNHFAIASDRGVVFLFIIDDRKDLSNSIYLRHTFNGNYNEIYRQMKFWNAEGIMFLALTSPLGNLTLYNILSRQIYDELLINAWTRSQTLCRGTDHQLLIGSAINVIYQLSWNETPENLNIKPINIGSVYEDLWWPVKGLCCQYEKTTLAIKYQLSMRIRYDDSNLKITKKLGSEHDSSPRKIYIPIPEVVIINEGSGLFIIVLNDFNQVHVRHHLLTRRLPGKIVSIVMHVNMLFLGTSSGSVHLFVLDNIQQLVNDNLSELPIAEVLPSGDEPILTLDITEVKKEPYIIAFTKSHLHVVQL